jgi:hypothetical protein
MGLNKSKAYVLKGHELDEFSKITAFSLDEINNLYTHFKAISSLERDDGVIDYDEWCAALETEKTLITQRLFNLLDENHDNVINFREFLLGISLLIEENFDSQIKVTYRIFDPDNSGIRPDFMVEILSSAVQLLDSICIPKNVIEEIVNKTFEEVNRDLPDKTDKNVIDYHQYRKMVKQNPQILKWLYINLERVKQSAKLVLKNPKKYARSGHIKSQSSIK